MLFEGKRAVFPHSPRKSVARFQPPCSSRLSNTVPPSSKALWSGGAFPSLHASATTTTTTMMVASCCNRYSISVVFSQGKTGLNKAEPSYRLLIDSNGTEPSYRLLIDSNRMEPSYRLLLASNRMEPHNIYSYRLLIASNKMEPSYRLLIDSKRMEPYIYSYRLLIASNRTEPLPRLLIIPTERSLRTDD